MYGIFMECWVALKLYGGNWALIIFFLLAALYLCFAEENLKKKIMLGIIPLLILAGFLFPVTKIVYVAVFDSESADTYYRILWMIPMYVVIAYAACKLINSLKKVMFARICLAVMLAVICLTGSLVYANKYITVAENPYHIPQSVINVCDRISPAEGQPRVRAAFPSDLVHFVRQYDTNIMMPYGREMLVYDARSWFNPVYEVMEKPEVINAKELLAATRETKCSYIVLREDRKIDADLTELGLTILDTVDGYIIYEDPVVIEG